MKTAYELAMERLNRTAPAVKLTARQKKDLAELDSQYAAKIAAREIHFQGRIAEVLQAGDPEAARSLEQELAAERRDLNAELDSKKDKIRQAGASRS